MEQINIFGNSEVGSEPKANDIKPVTIKNGEYLFSRDFISPNDCDSLFKIFREKIIWKQEKLKIYGKEINFPRLTAWYGDVDKSYTFSGITLNPHPWSAELLLLKHKVEFITEHKFNSVLLNLYRDGNDSISWHTDAEQELGLNPVIASVNLGDSRIFQLRHFATKEKIELNLSNGSLLIMRGELQHYWQHQVPKTKAQKKERINLTFRAIK